jgi:hypothetical protein
MELIVASSLTLICTVAGALVLARIRGIASRAEGKMMRALDGIPDAADRARWQEELRRTLLEFEGRPLKQSRESRQLVRAAERLVEVYAPAPASPEADSQAVTSDRVERGAVELGANVPLAQVGRRALVDAMENLSYRERRVLELLYGLGGEREYSAEEVGMKFNVYADRIGQIEVQALKKIQALIEAQKLREAH